MPIKVTCPKCQGVLHAPDDAGGKRGKCPTCGTVLAIPAAGMAPPAAEPFAPPESPFRAPVDDPPRAAVPSEQRRSSTFGTIPRPPEADPRRGSGSRIPPAPGTNFGAPADPRKASEPFAKPGKAPAPPAAAPSDARAKAWRKCRSGLWWVQASLYWFILAPLCFIGISIAEHFGTKLPSEMPGFLKIAELSSDVEIKTAVVVIPFVLGMFALTIGRFGVANAPRSSYAKGLSLASALATMMALFGMTAVLFAVGGQLATGFKPIGLLPADDITGIMERVGLIVAVVFLVLADLGAAIAYGRMAAVLDSPRLAGRSTRYLLLYCLKLIVVVGLIAAVGYFASVKVESSSSVTINIASSQRFWNEEIEPLLAKLGEQRPVAILGAVALAGLFGWLVHVRLVGGARAAIRNWLADHDPV